MFGGNCEELLGEGGFGKKRNQFPWTIEVDEGRRELGVG